MIVEIPALDDLLLNFESFGDNCEFGVFQRQAGLEPLGLFRFSFTPMLNLLKALQNRFENIAALDQIDILVAKNTELIVHLKEYGIYYHAGKHEGEIEIETLKRDEQKKVSFLIRRLGGTLTAGEKIFVRKGEGVATHEQARELLNEMRAYGPANLLWVSKADDTNPPGTVCLLEPGLLQGWIDSFAPDVDAHSIGFTGWVDICENAYSLWKSEATIGTRLAPPLRVDQAANLLYGGDRAVDIVVQPHPTITEVMSGSFPLRDPVRPTLCRHILGTTADAMVTLRVSGLQPGTPYSFSFWTRVPPGNDVVQLNIAISGAAMIRGRRVDLQQRHMWQRLEYTARAGADGILFPRMAARGEPGAVVETANWRLEVGLLVGARENPSAYPALLPEPLSSVTDAAREIRVS